VVIYFFRNCWPGKNIFYYFPKAKLGFNKHKKIIIYCFLGLILFAQPFLANADQLDELANENQEIAESQEMKVTKSMTKEQIEDLFGPEPYLGQTSWLGSQEN
tara:strand:+ start:2149 stop:2457 length:309 start_codon:yes stop_codon:yes gene_type:complete